MNKDSIDTYELDFTKEFEEVDFESVKTSAAFGVVGCCICERTN